jgi:hypothetical protein
MLTGQNRLSGLKLFTDETGILQHSMFGVIDRRHGYTTDDNSRALVAAVRFHSRFGGDEPILLAKRYLEFLLYMHVQGGGFHNLISYDKKYLDKKGTEDSIGHALWATGCTLNSRVPLILKKLSKWLFDESLPVARGFTSPRAKAFALLGLCDYSRAYPNDENLLEDITKFSDFLVQKYIDAAEPEWQWFEPYVTYANARLPQALIESYQILNNQNYLNVAKKTLNFLIDAQFNDGIFIPIGTKGWFHKGKQKAVYDQQPIESACMTEAAFKAAEVLTGEKYIQRGYEAFQWFQGKNISQQPLIDTSNYTCYDGLTSTGVNQNKGAESLISYLLAEISLPILRV